MTAVGAAAAAVAVWLLLPGRGSLPRADAGPAARRSAGRWLPAIPLVVGAALPLWVTGPHLVLGLIVLGTAVAGAAIGQRARRARLADARRAVVVEICEALAGELRAGQPFVVAIEHCCELWPSLQPVVAAARLDADVPAALRRCAEDAGAEGLREIASAWQVSHRSGSGLAGALAQVAVTARARQATQALVRGELASAQATARLVAVLPFASLTMSAGLGGRPWHFLLGTLPGLGCLAAGISCAFAGLLWIDRIAAGVLRSAA